ncbi:MAG: class I SAM-dependent methyltransferase [Candidatus Marinimicrobia bacterium]|nr:class I SAM-dependent methyltransferase [Candidatus Neomarinimicrobiota bacterium]
MANFYNEYILKKAEEYGFGEPTKSNWINYMMNDVLRGENLLNVIMRNCNNSLSEKDRALDIGCAFGGMLIALKKFFKEIDGIEIVKDRVQWAKIRCKEANIIHGNATKLPWPDSHFNLVLCSDVLEHVQFDQQQIIATELMRVLKPGGCGFIQVPNRFQLMDEHNKVFFATFLPKPLRYLYVKALGSNRNYLHCYELSGKGWKHLFKSKKFKLKIEPYAYYKGKHFFPPQRFNIHLH